jgi:hypothetical protein
LQVAWNSTLGYNTKGYKKILKTFLRSKPNLWSELLSRNPEELIEKMRKEKKIPLSK